MHRKQHILTNKSQINIQTHEYLPLKLNYLQNLQNNNKTRLPARKTCARLTRYSVQRLQFLYQFYILLEIFATSRIRNCKMWHLTDVVIGPSTDHYCQTGHIKAEHCSYIGTVRHISFSSLLSLQTLYKAQTSKQFKVLRCRDLTCVDVELATPRYMVAIKLSNFTHVFQAMRRIRTSIKLVNA